jgi:hypothetical protein
LAYELGKSLTSVRLGTLCRGDASNLGRAGLLGCKPRRLRSYECIARALHLAAEFELFSAQCPCFSIELFGIATVVLIFGFGLLVAHALGRQLNEAMKAFAQPTQCEPRLLRCRQTRRVLRRLLLSFGLLCL